MDCTNPFLAYNDTKMLFYITINTLVITFQTQSFHISTTQTQYKGLSTPHAPIINTVLMRKITAVKRNAPFSKTEHFLDKIVISVALGDCEIGSGNGEGVWDGRKDLG